MGSRSHLLISCRSRALTGGAARLGSSDPIQKDDPKATYAPYELQAAAFARHLLANPKYSLHDVNN
jgi:hypothetical protein